MASALLVDYVLTVAVSISSAVAVRRVGAPVAASATRGLCAVGLVVLIVLMNLRGVRESGTAFAVPTYGFMLSILGMVALRRSSGSLRATLPHGRERRLRPWSAQGTFAGLGAGASCCCARSPRGCAALTGVEAISNGVPAFQKPKCKNAATTLLLLGVIAVTMLMSIIVLAGHATPGCRSTENDVDQLLPDGVAGRRRPTQQDTVIVQLAAGRLRRASTLGRSTRHRDDRR